MSLLAGSRRGAMGRKKIDLMSGLVGWWSLDEASGSRADSHVNALTLTDNNTVTQQAGVVGNAAQFDAANLEYLSRADETLLRHENRTYALALWARLTSTADRQNLVSKDSLVNGDFNFMFLETSVRFLFQMTDGSGNNVGRATANTFGAPSANTWYFLVGQYDAPAARVSISVNAGTIDTGALTGTPGDSTSPFEVGRDGFGVGVQYLTGGVDELALWKGRVLTSREISWLYNGGLGRAYPPRER